MEGIFDAYVLWPFDKKFIFELVTGVKTRDFTVVELSPASSAHHFPPVLFSFVVNDDDHELAHFTKSTFAYFLSGRVIITFWKSDFAHSFSASLRIKVDLHFWL